MEVDLVESIYSRLRDWRRSMAAALGLPPYIIMSNAHLAGVALAAPATVAELAHCPGIGEKKLSQFGPALLDLVAQAVAEGLEPGVVAPEPPAPQSPPAEADPTAIIAAARKEIARLVAKRLKGQYSSGQIEKVLATWNPAPQQEAAPF